MSPVTKSPVSGEDSPPRPINFGPSHHRTGRWVLLGEAVLLGALGVWGLVAGISYPAVRFGAR